ncbi:MAG: MFS transporter [Alphaproteobacteria bacterium]|nr:MFS transporter [Alphaproteobacteria bacterium]
MSMSSPRAAAVSAVSDVPSTYAKKALFGSAIGYAMDGFDLLILGFMLGAIRNELGLSGPQAGSLFTFTLLGAVTGGIVFGIMSDYFGRVRVLSWTILLFAIFTGLCALSRGYYDLLTYRTIAGLGLGGEFGIGMALAAEAWPASLRGRVSSYVGLGWQSGVLIAAFVTPFLLPHIGWRGMFLVGVLPAVVAFIVRRTIGEPEIFVQRHIRQGFPIGLLFKDTATVKVTVGMFILCAVQNFGYYGVMIWLPSYLNSQFHFPLMQSAVWTAVTILGMALGIWLFGVAADHFGRRPVFMFWQIGAAIMVIVFSQLTTPYTLLVGGAAMGFFINGMLGGLGALMSELYPTAARATAQNVLFNLGRGVGGFGPFVVPILAAKYSFPIAIALLAVIYVIEFVATVFLIPERKGVPLE